ncbi:MAG: 30S ribosomal protein S6 [Deltaproteobacteria bacterium]|nr:30S ribosomal protein S6 [Deltaproteobacteria bacterium]NCP97112.1 30S ribosomal protein S6 [Deltaproteobacteria bacterium]NCS73536.1 30S ribosomal protein S6 [Deltaproteobacteria bacterium]OIP64591.1 MAG: 30S ribosomal protein S6 [Nitrospirae bacterium CG2_30_70_394]
MRLYETIFITLSALTDDEIKALTDGVKGVITSHHGEVVKEEDWGVKVLAYEVDNHSKGHYVLLQFRGDNETLRELERQYRYNESIIKFQTLRVDEK